MFGGYLKIPMSQSQVCKRIKNRSAALSSLSEWFIRAVQNIHG